MECYRYMARTKRGDTFVQTGLYRPAQVFVAATEAERAMALQIRGATNAVLDKRAIIDDCTARYGIARTQVAAMRLWPSEGAPVVGPETLIK